MTTKSKIKNRISTVVQLCKKRGLNPKVVRAKLRRAVANGLLEHEHREPWKVTPPLLKVLDKRRA